MNVRVSSTVTFKYFGQGSYLTLRSHKIIFRVWLVSLLNVWWNVEDSVLSGFGLWTNSLEVVFGKSLVYRLKKIELCGYCLTYNTCIFCLKIGTIFTWDNSQTLEEQASFLYHILCNCQINEWGRNVFPFFNAFFYECGRDRTWSH